MGETMCEYSEGGGGRVGEWRGRQCGSIVREEVGKWRGRQCASIVREKESEWVSGGGACHYVMDLHMAKHPGTIYYILYIENFMAQIFFENLVY